MPEWTEQQRQVIDSDKREILCSAAAGSGKTAVLVERVVRMFRDGCDPGAFLIITFTNAAASEMKEKIRNRLTEELDHPLIRKAFEKCDEIQISTIHAFCQQLIRTEFQSIGLDPLFSICDKNQQESLFQEAFTLTCDRLLEEKNESYRFLTEYYTCDEARDLTNKICDFMISLPDPAGWLKRAVGSIPDRADDDHPWFQTVRAMVREKLSACRVCLWKMNEMLSEPGATDKFEEYLKTESDMVERLSGDLSPEAWSQLNFPRLTVTKGSVTPDPDWKERYSDLHQRFKKIMQQISKLLDPDRETMNRELSVVRKVAEGLCLLTEMTAAEFREQKRKKNLADFSDLEHYALEILSDRVCRESVRKRYRYTFVDECQDISAVQDAIITQLHGPDNSLFMVGDVKQSIYRFRMADPTIFLERMKLYEEEPDENRICIRLQNNFRSRPEILETVNTVFRSVMRREVTELDYTEKEELIPGRKTEGYYPVCVDILNQEEAEPFETEAEHIAGQIRNLMTEPRGGDEKQGHYSYKDMVILMPTMKTDGAKLAALLEERGVPVFFDGDREYYTQTEIVAFRRMLELMVDPYNDLALITVLHGTPFFFDENELSLIRLKKNDSKSKFCEAFEACCADDTPFGSRCASAREKIAEWRLVSTAMKLSDYIWYLFGETGFYALSGSETNGASRQANLRILCEEAVRAEKNGTATVDRFLRYMKDQASSGDQRSACLLGENDDLVRIMTIHKSKGLQFPVVFCVGLDKKPQGKPSPTALKMHAKLGLLLRYKNPKLRVSRETYAGEIFTWRTERDEKAEKVRLLYVAMTRAQERMFLMTRKGSDPLWELPDSDYRVAAAGSYTNWVIPPLADAQGKELYTDCAHARKPWIIRGFEYNHQITVDSEHVFHSLKEWLETTLSYDAVDDLWKKSSGPSATGSIVKRSVTGLLAAADRPAADGAAEEETAGEKRMPDAIERALKKYEISEYPACMNGGEKTTGAMYGTLVHKLLSMLDLDRIRQARDVREAVLSEKERLRERGAFTVEEAARISTRDVTAWLCSPVGRRMLASEDVRREWEFSLSLEKEARMILQGVIDCAFLENGKWVIVDYKTDRVDDPAAFAERYRPQVEWYAVALERLTGIPVGEKLLWSVSLSREFRLDSARDS